jgi:serine/threonine-protein kinase RsbW
MAAASLAVELDFDVDEIDDLRMGVNELVALLVDAADGAEARIDVVFTVGDDSIEMRAELVSEPAAVVEPDAIARRVLDAVVDRWSLDDAGAVLAKTRRG